MILLVASWHVSARLNSTLALQNGGFRVRRVLYPRLAGHSLNAMPCARGNSLPQLMVVVWRRM